MNIVKPHTKPKAKPRETWVRSSRCVGGDCLEARRVGRVVVVRDSKLGEVSPLQAWARDEWHELLGGVRRAGPLSDGVGSPFGHVAVAVDVVDGRVEFGLVRHEILSFTFEEWNAFVADVLAGEFDFENLPTPAAAVSAGGSVAARGTAAAPAGPPPVNPCPWARYGQDPEAVLAVAADGEPCLPEAAHPSGSLAGRPDPDEGEAFDGACATDLSPAGRGPHEHVVNVLDEALFAVTSDPWNTAAARRLAQVLVDEGLLAAEWVVAAGVDVDDELRRAAAPLVEHISESSSAAGGDSAGDPVAAMGGAAVPSSDSSAAGGEVVPDPVGVRKAGTTEPEGGAGR